MTRFFSRYVQFFIPTVALVAIGLAFMPVGAVQTTDETELLQNILENQQPRSTVLGENSRQNTSQCDEAKPIIGWIDFSGKKTVRNSLPDNMRPSACFSTIEAARDAGFVYKQ